MEDTVEMIEQHYFESQLNKGEKIKPIGMFRYYKNSLGNIKYEPV